jgi:hypothetical protein
MQLHVRAPSARRARRRVEGPDEGRRRRRSIKHCRLHERPAEDITIYQWLGSWHRRTANGNMLQHHGVLTVACSIPQAGFADLLTRGADDLDAERAGSSPYARWPAPAVAFATAGRRRRGNSCRMGHIQVSPFNHRGPGCRSLLSSGTPACFAR